MRETHIDGYKPGDPWEVCPRCGLDYRASEMIVEHTGKRVCREMCADEHPKTPSSRYGGN